MPRTWSNHRVDHIDLNTPGKGKMPTAGWIIFGVGLGALVIFTALAIRINLHPISTDADSELPSASPASASAPAR